MSLFDLSFVLARSPGTVLKGREGVGIEQVCIDSREARSGSLFVALPGEKTEGHQFVGQALERGAAAALVSQQWASRQSGGPPEGKSWLIASSPLQTLQDLARGYLAGFPDLKRLAVTGSNGKTTTKEIAGSILSKAGPSLYSAGNFNSDIGLPLTVFRVRSEHRWALFEMGMNRKGEIGELVDIVKPDRALVTNVGTAHVGMLGSREALAYEKKSIFSRFDGNQTGIVWEEDPYKEFLLEGLNGEALTYGSRSLEGFEGAESLGLDGQLLHFRQGDIHLKWWGGYNLQNCLAALALTDGLGIPWETRKAGVEASTPLFGRSEVLKGPVTLVRDCYNANPESMFQSLEALDQLEYPGRKILVLGDMGELGEESSEGHAKVLGRAVQSRPDLLFTLGEQMKKAGEDLGRPVQSFLDWDDLKEALLRQAGEGDLIWLKGSRTLELERLTEPLMNP